MEKDFTKDMLETGMVIETKDGMRFVVFKERNIITNGDEWNDLYDYDENLKVIDYPSGGDAVKVYGQSSLCSNALCNSIGNRQLLWERKLEVTMQEIADKFGVSVDALKIKK